MGKQLIVNVAGANASGKTTLMRNVLATDPQGGANTLDLVAPDGTKLAVHCLDLGLERPVSVIGKYDDSKYSGCDKVKSADAIDWAVRTRVDAGTHVIYEGFRVSKSYSRRAALRNQLTADRSRRFGWVFLHAPVELIYERCEARRNPDSRPMDRNELAAVVRQMDKTRRTVLQLWPEDALTLDPKETPPQLFQRLRAWLLEMEQG